LRDKFAVFQAEASAPVTGENGSELMQDAVSALVNLGYRKTEIEKSLRDIIQSGKQSLEEVIKESLRRMSR